MVSSETHPEQGLIGRAGYGEVLEGEQMVRNRGACGLRSRGATLAVLTAAALATTACGDKQKVKGPGDAPASRPDAAPEPARGGEAARNAPDLTPPERYRLALSLMQQGQGEKARAELLLIQQREPENRRVTMLLRQIDTDPRQLYGADSFVITVNAGDTLFSLARKYLRDPLNFYGLARFNNLTPPVELRPGQSFSIPGRAKMMDRPVRRPAAPPAAGRSPATAPSDTAPPTVDPAARRAEAQRLRAQGLEQLSAQSIDRAVTLLSQAASLDPDNGAIAGDLARARRIQATVRSR